MRVLDGPAAPSLSMLARRIGALVLLLAGLVFAHWESLAAMVGQWSRSPMYSYAYSVPFISGYLLWSRRSSLAALQPAAAWGPGIAVLTVGITTLFVGHAGGFQLLQQLAFLINLVGTVLILFGWQYVRVGWAGLAYLLLMVPLWDGFTEPMHVPFQNQSAAIGIEILRLIGIPAHREGVFLSLPNLSIEVARACSGVNYLIAVIALGLPLSYLYLDGIARRVLLVAGAVVIAALSNGLRVALICTLAYYQIGSPLHGPFHVLHGLFVAGIGYVVLFAGLRWLAKPARTLAPAPATAVGLRGLDVRSLAGLAVFFWGLGVAPWVLTTGAVPLETGLEAVPLNLGAWTGEPLPVRGPDSSTWWATADRQLRRRYDRPGGPSCEVYIAYYEAQRQNRELAGGRVAELHRGADAISIPLSDGSSLRANLRKGDAQKQPTLFWYEINGVVETRRTAAVLRTAWNALVHQRSDGAVVVVSALDPRPADDPAALAGLEDLAARLHVALRVPLGGSSLLAESTR